MRLKFLSVLLFVVFGLVSFIGFYGPKASFAQTAEFCWRDSYGRGVGKVPTKCSSDQQKIGALCYKKCGKNMKRFGFDCHSVCPAGFKSKGLFCRKDTKKYNRGAGRGPKKCEKKFGKGKCEKRAGLWYQKCRKGYVRSGVFCLPDKPNCSAIGMKKGLAGRLGCAKRIQVGKPKTGRCPSGQQKDGGLCYKKCKTGYKGVGPVCWTKAPKSWVECGMGAAKNKTSCGSVTFSQVSSVGKLALNVATLGSSSAATKTDDPSEISGLQKQLKDMKAAYDAFKKSKEGQAALKAYKAGKDGYKVYSAAEEAGSIQKPTVEDIVRLSAMIAAIADPSGVANTVAAYTYPKCSKIFK